MVGIELVEDTRPAGALRMADPSAAEFPRNIHTFNEPHSNQAARGSEQNGVRTVTGALVPYHDRRGGGPEYSFGRRESHDAAWSAMNKKRGVSDDCGEKE